MRIRSVKPEFWRDEVTGLMECDVALFYVGLCAFADDAGCFEWSPQLIRADIDPFDAKWGGLKNIERELSRLEGLRRVVSYVVAGRKYGRILSFRGHQSPKKPAYRCPTGPQEVPNLFGTDSEPGSEQVPSGSGGGSGEGSGGGEGADLNSAPDLPPDESPVVVVLPCVGDGPKEFAVTEAAIAAWRDAYPGLDPTAEAKRMKFWLDANPVKRKTHRGMPRFIASWLSRSQDRVGALPGGAKKVTAPASKHGEFKGGASGF